MTDLEITKLCAEAMGWRHLGAVGVPVPPEGERDKSGLWCMSGGNDWWIHPDGHHVCGPCSGIPDPLHDDAQAMALVKKVRILLDPDYGFPCVWQAATNTEDATNEDLNRAICECTAKMMQKQKEE